MVVSRFFIKLPSQQKCGVWLVCRSIFKTNFPIFLLKWPLIAVLIVVIQSCTSINPTHGNIAKDASLAYLTPQETAINKTTSQLLQAGYGQKTYSINLVTRIAPEQVKIIGLTKFGSRLFTLEYSDHQLKLHRTMFLRTVSALRPEYIFADMQLIYWPIAAIRHNLSRNVTVTESARQRKFIKNGQPFIEIDYSSKDKWRGSVRFTQHERNYTYVLKNL